MAGRADRRSRVIGPVRALSAALLVSLSSSCGSTLVYLTDPYTARADGSPRPRIGLGFRLAARLRGYAPELILSDGRRSLADLIGEDALPGFVVATPLAAASLPAVRGGARDYPVVVVGGRPAARADAASGVRLVLPDRSDAFLRAGRLAGARAALTGKPGVLLMATGTPEREREREALRTGYSRAAPGTPPLEEYAWTAGSEEPLPPGFVEAAGDASVLLLFAGAADVRAAEAGAETAVPIVTEDIARSGAWDGRVAATIEENRASRNRVLRRALADPGAPEPAYYGGRIRSGGYPGARRLLREARRDRSGSG